MRLGSVMSVIEVIQPVCSPARSTSGDTYIRVSNTVPSLRFTRVSNPLAGASPRSTISRFARWRSRSSSGQ